MISIGGRRVIQVGVTGLRDLTGSDVTRRKANIQVEPKA